MAEEVRALAQRSAGASHEIKQLIETTVTRVDAGNAVVSEVVDAMETINATTLELSQAMEEIAAASAEQAAGVDELNRAIAQVDTGTQSNAGIVEELAASANVMYGSAAELLDAVSTFKTRSQGGFDKPARQGGQAKPPASPRAANTATEEDSLWRMSA